VTSRRRIEVVAYDSNWVSRFDLEAEDLRGVLGQALVAVHHVGSTAVPGIKAKPTIDILLEVTEGCHIPSLDPASEVLGYVCRGECLDGAMPGTPGRFYYVRKEDVVHRTHVHACTMGYEEIEKMLCFRDYLISNPGAAQLYTNLKVELASRFPYDNSGYMKGKEVCAEVYQSCYEGGLSVVRKQEWSL
jgi:GrpB-like predicted nucleotidyltransferase (UPF0157 family)